MTPPPRSGSRVTILLLFLTVPGAAGLHPTAGGAAGGAETGAIRQRAEQLPAERGHGPDPADHRGPAETRNGRPLPGDAAAGGGDAEGLVPPRRPQTRAGAVSRLRPPPPPPPPRRPPRGPPLPPPARGHPPLRLRGDAGDVASRGAPQVPAPPPARDPRRRPSAGCVTPPSRGGSSWFPCVLPFFDVLGFFLNCGQ